MDTEVAIIGAGPHGLSAAIHLRRAGIESCVIGDPMSFWQGMPEGMKLRSGLSATSIGETTGPLSLKQFGEEIGQQISYPVPLEQFVEYGLWVQERAVPGVHVDRVTGLQRVRDGFALATADGERVSARRVVVACGIESFAYFPPGFEHLPSERISHTGQHRQTAGFAGQRVAVIGGGQSAFECAALLSEAGARPELLARTRDVVWLRRKSPKGFLGPLGEIAYAPTDVGPLWYSRLVATPDLFRRLSRRAQQRIAYRSIRPACSHFVRVRLDGIGVTLGVSIVQADLGSDGIHLRLSDGTTREVDHLMFGTGYRVDVGRYPFLDQALLANLKRVDGYPILSRGLETSVPGLHMVGAPAAWSFGPTMRFVSGSWYAGRSVARRIAETSQPSFAVLGRASR